MKVLAISGNVISFPKMFQKFVLMAFNKFFFFSSTISVPILVAADCVHWVCLFEALVVQFKEVEITIKESFQNLSKRRRNS